ncbi:MAG: 16S rRNA (uracil(1498)-N(3))-methyltransferase [Spirochaetaceae bacterium]|nr:16S rRNA (uracil(1498)-N(3))-methyltransferase [Spirochaetaceae bacterium]
MRQYVAAKEFDKTQRLVVLGKDFRYLVQVLRLKEGEVLEVRLPSGNLAQAVIEKIQSKQLLLRKEEHNLSEIETGVKASDLVHDTNGAALWLFQFMPKVAKFDGIIRQAVECGVAYIVPVLGDFSPKTGDAHREERWNRIVKEATQQSGSSVLTKVFSPCSLEVALQLWEKESKKLAFFLNEKIEGEKSLRRLFLQERESDFSFQHIGIAVGCEGGYSEKEIELLKEHNFNSIHFETNILRCETASLYGIAIVQNTYWELMHECN